MKLLSITCLSSLIQGNCENIGKSLQYVLQGKDFSSPSSSWQGLSERGLGRGDRTVWQPINDRTTGPNRWTSNVVANFARSSGKTSQIRRNWREFSFACCHLASDIRSARLLGSSRDVSYALRKRPRGSTGHRHRAESARTPGGASSGRPFTPPT